MTEAANDAEALRSTIHRQRAIVETLADPVVAFDKQRRYTYVSRGAAQSLAKTPDEMIGRSMWELFPGEIDMGFKEACQRAWAEGRPVTVERHSKVLDRWVESYIYQFENGASTRWRDITEQKRAAQRLQDSEGRYSARFHNRTNAIAHCRTITDENGRPIAYRVIEVNHAYELVTGIKKVSM